MLWRAISGAISSRLALFRRKLVTNPLCPICNCFEESVEHILFLCTWTHPVWFGSVFSYRIIPNAFTTLDRWLHDMLSIPDTPHEDFLHRFSLLSFLCWEIWKARCDFVFKGTNPDPRLVIKRANDSYSEFWEANTCFSRLSGSRTTPSSPYVGRDRWLPPLANAIKINFDGAWSPGTSHGGIGVIARDDCGTWRGGTASPISCNSALVAEAAAALYAVSYAITRDFSKVVFESDSKVFVDSILGNHGNYSWTILPILDEICSLSQHFNEMRWKWVPRSANRAAHMSATIGLRAMELQSWVIRPPLSLVGVLNSDGLPCPPVGSSLLN
ncbi:hypothetical protein GBA52_024934 [Prunus armeniaca]|nr:hypothetical protein GBA52_024934 [Prunus armeniaca]